MPQRLRLYDMRLSELPSIIGACSSDVTQIARAVNTAQRRLLFAKEAGDESWFGTWAEIVFTIDPNNPYITLPRNIARLEAIDVNNRTVQIRNPFFEYLQFGNGRMPKTLGQGWCRIPQVFTRNLTPTLIDLSNPPQIIVVYPTDQADVGKRVLLQGLDNNNQTITTQDGRNRVQGVYVTLDFPFVTSAPYQFNRLLGIQKDITSGTVTIAQMSPTTGALINLSQMDPGEQTAWYRRYLLNPLPCNPCLQGQCTGATLPTITATAIAKLDLIPVVTDSDWCLLQNIEAIIEEAKSARYSRMDTAIAKRMAEQHHIDAIRLLNGELSHYYGKNTPEVNFKPFGSARLERKFVGMI